MKRVLVCLLVCSCPGPKLEPAFDREVMLANISERAAVPAYEALRDRTAALQTSITALCSATGTREAAQQAWRDAYTAYKRTEAIGFGPAVDTRLVFALDAYPVKVDAVEGYATTVTTKTGVDELGTAGKGLPVIEYLLFTRTDLACPYLKALSEHAAEKAQATHVLWLDYRLSSFSSQAAAIDALVNQLAATVHSANEMQVLKPLGRKDGGTPQPQAVAARFSATAKEALLATLDGVEAVYRGGEDKGLVALVRHADARKGTTVADGVSAALNNAHAAVNASRPLAAAVIEAPAEVEAIVTALDELEQTIAVDAAGLLGVSLTFSDADGD